MSCQIRLGALAGMLIVGVSMSASAQPTLEYDAPDECPSFEFVFQTLIHRVEVRPDGVDERTVSMRIAQIPEAENPYVLEIVLHGPDVSGVRRISGRDCAALVDAGIVVTAIALGARPETLSEPMVEVASVSITQVPSAEAQPAEAAPPPRDETSIEEPPVEEPPLDESPMEPVEQPRVDEAPEERSLSEESPSEQPNEGTRRPLHLGGWITGRLSIGEAPTVTGAGALGLHLVLSRFRTELAFQWLPRSTGEVEGNVSAGATFAFFMAEARFCGDVVLRPVVLSLCGGAELGATRAEGSGADVTTRQTVLWIAPEVDAILLWAFTRSGRVGLRIDASFLVPLYRSTFYIERMGDIYRPSPVAGKFGLGFFVNFF